MYRSNPIVHSDIDYLKALIVNAIAAPQFDFRHVSPYALKQQDAELFLKILNDIVEEYPQHKNYGMFLYNRLLQTGLTGQSLLYLPAQQARYEQHSQKQHENQLLYDILDFLSRFDRWKLSNKVIQKQLQTPKSFHVMPGIELQLTIDLNVHDFFQWFGIEIPDISDLYLDIPLEEEDLADTYLLDITLDDGALYDANGREIDYDTSTEIQEALRWAIESDAITKISQAAEQIITDICMTFHDINYEFWYIPAEDLDISQDYAEGIAKGIQQVSINEETITIKTFPDLCLEIANCIYGYGMLNAVEDEWKYNAKEFIKTRFHWLKWYWDIYGESKPKLDLEFEQEVDEPYFKELIREIEERTGLKLQ